MYIALGANHIVYPNVWMLLFRKTQCNRVRHLSHALRSHTLNANNTMLVSHINCKLKHYISIVVICGSYMFDFKVSLDMEK